MTAVVVEVDAHEGPVYVPEEDALYFTSVPAPDSAIKRLALGSGEVSVVRADANRANGMALHPDGRLVVCEQGTRTAPARIALVDRATGAAETLVDGWGGLPLNSPNDVVVHSDGAVWFTDPSYGWLQGFRPPPMLGDAVYRHDPATGSTTVVAQGFDKPNGLAFSPDERVLYVANTRWAQYIHAFELDGSGNLLRRRIFADMSSDETDGVPDGMKVDVEGRVYCTGPGGTWVFAPDGSRLGIIRTPEVPANVAFGGPDLRTLFLTARTSVYTLRVKVPGHPHPWYRIRSR